MPNKNLTQILLLLGSLFHYQAFSQEAVRMPSDAEIAAARKQAREILEKIPASASGNLTPQQRAAITPSSVPNLSALPKPAVSAPDISQLADHYRQAGKLPTQALQSAKIDLMVFVSLGMPDAGLQRIVEQAERAQATLVFRGLKGNKLQVMATEMRRLIGGRKVDAVIQPEMFKQYAITQVPALVIARQEAAQVDQEGCAPSTTFTKVTGDVSLDYALEHIEKHSPTWSATASSFKKRLVKSL